MDENPNPVFGYRAEFRRTAKRTQNLLSSAGVLVLLATLPCLLFTPLLVATVLAVIGTLLLLVGVSWGFYWRSVLRDEFQKKFSSRP